MTDPRIIVGTHDWYGLLMCTTLTPIRYISPNNNCTIVYLYSIHYNKSYLPNNFDFKCMNNNIMYYY